MTMDHMHHYPIQIEGSFYKTPFRYSTETPVEEVLPMLRFRYSRRSVFEVQIRICYRYNGAKAEPEVRNYGSDLED